MQDYDTMCDILEHDLKPGTYVAILYYKYRHDDRYNASKEVFEHTGTDICWFNDWWEGQEDIILVATYDIEMLVHSHLELEEIKSTMQLFEKKRAGENI